MRLGELTNELASQLRLKTVTATEGLRLLEISPPTKIPGTFGMNHGLFFLIKYFFMTWESTYLSLSEDKFHLDKISFVNHS